MKPPVEYRPRNRQPVAQSGSAPASGAGGREFKSHPVDQPKKSKSKFDRAAYQREYMRRYRARQKAAKT